MKRRWLTTWGLIGLGVMAFGIDAATAQTTANGPYYATPSWDQKLQCDTLATCPRFVVLANWNSEAVLDRETGLVWEKVPDAFERTWRDASLHCAAERHAGRFGWRLPTLQELGSLYEKTPPGFPALPSGHPFTVQVNVPHWSATTSVDAGSLAWVVNFEGGFFGDTVTKSLSHRAWCVRGGQGVDPQ